MRCSAMSLFGRFPLVGWLLVFAAFFAAKLAWADPYKPDAGAYEVQSELMELRDGQRGRDVPVRVYWPVGAEGARPVVLVSHGLGGTREGLSYLGKHWASHGYICVHMQHHGSDDAVWKDVDPRDRLSAMRKAARDPQNAIDRAGDTTFVLDRLKAMHADEASGLFGRLDLEKAGIAGHSFGAWTCLAAGGLTVGGRNPQQLSDARIKCMIPLSPPVSSMKRYHEQSYSSLAVPALMMTGTLDTTPINNTKAEDRVIPYRLMPGVSEGGHAKYLINFDSADHMTFSGETKTNRLLRDADPETDPVFHGLILQSTTAFLDCYLLGNDEAKKWLNDGAFVETVGEHGEVEMDAG